MKIRTVLVGLVASVLLVGLSVPAEAATTPPSKTGSFFVGFNTATPTGGVNAAYSGYWQPYPDGMSNKYYSNQVTSIHDGVLDMYLHDNKGAAGTFGTPDGAWGHKGGTFSIRMRTRDGEGNGLAVMLWPTSDVASDGELDFPEGEFSENAHIYHHFNVVGQESKSIGMVTGASMRDWHTYTMQWQPPKSGSAGYVKYYVDDVLQRSVTQYVPTTAHRFMIQTGKSSKGHVYIDWVRTTE